MGVFLDNSLSMMRESVQRKKSCACAVSNTQRVHYDQSNTQDIYIMTDYGLTGGINHPQRS